MLVPSQPCWPPDNKAVLRIFLNLARHGANDTDTRYGLRNNSSMNFPFGEGPADSIASMKVLSRCFTFLVPLCLVSEVLLGCSRCPSFLAPTIAGDLIVMDCSLVGYELNKLDVEDYRACIVACMKNCLCMSFNFKTNPTQGERNQCQLNWERRDTNLTALINKPGTSYHDIQAMVSSIKVN